ncbi:exopolyphosphatase-like protein [Nemania sp. FL0031]|nr:exopolyphosphatase-like protein [Nemania sp. FL0031]
MTPRASLKTFLATARAVLTAPPSKRPTPLTFVVGNESADLDSLCSALLLAYFHTYAPPLTRQGSVGDGGAEGLASTLHIPVCHLYRADLALRPEFAAVLRDAGVQGEDMFTLEDVLPLPAGRHQAESKSHEGEGVRPEDTRWLLVDHNAMTGALANRFAARVIGCVDHHADEDVMPRNAEPRVIEKSGSCASLVLERCAGGWEALSSAASGSLQNGVENENENKSDEVLENAKIEAQLARLALAPILIDTVNLKDKSKTTAHDEAAVALAEAKIAAYAELLVNTDTNTDNAKINIQTEEIKDKYNRTAFFTRISALKEDISEMSFQDIFRKDYKEWDVARLHLGTSSVPQSFQYLVEQKAQNDPSLFISEMGTWGAEKDGAVPESESMDIVVLLTTFQDDRGRFCRELLIWARSKAGVRAAKLFEERFGGTLGLESWGDGALDFRGDGEGEWRRCWAQRAVEHSRKQIAPMLRDVLKEVSGRG